MITVYLLINLFYLALINFEYMTMEYPIMPVVFIYFYHVSDIKPNYLLVGKFFNLFNLLFRDWYFYYTNILL